MNLNKANQKPQSSPRKVVFLKKVSIYLFIYLPTSKNKKFFKEGFFNFDFMILL
jgi:hypothetical protein